MSEINTESSTADSPVVLSEELTALVLPSVSSSNTDDVEARRRKIMSKMWGKGSTLSHKVRELDKSTLNNSSDSSTRNDHDQQQSSDNLNKRNNSKLSIEENSNSISISKPLAVVKPIVVVKLGLIVAHAADRRRVNSEASSATVTQVDSTVTERPSSSSTTTTDRTSRKKKKSHKNEDSKKKKSTRNDSPEKHRSHHHHQTDENTSTKNSSTSKTHRRDEEISTHHKSSRSSIKQRSPSSDRKLKKDEPVSSKKSTLSPTDYRRSNSKVETTPYRNHSSHRHRHGSSISLSPSPRQSRHSTTNGDRLQSKNSSSPKRDDRTSTTTTKSNRPQTESVTTSKSTNSISPSDSYLNHRRHGSDVNDTNRHKTRTSDEKLTNSSKTQKPQDISPYHNSSSTSIKYEKSKSITNNEENDLNRRKISLSRHDRRSHSRHRSRSKEEKTNRKVIEPSKSDEISTNKHKTNNDKDSTIAKETSNNDKKSSRGSSIPSTNDNHRRKSSPDHHRYELPRRHDYHHHHRHRVPSPHSYYPNTHYIHHHHYHHNRSASSRYHHYRRSISPRSHPRRSTYFSSTSSSSSLSPRRRSPSQSSSSSRSSSSYSSISRTSSSRSSSRNNHYYHQKKFRRSPTLEKLFLKASESIESVSTQKNPNASLSSHLIPIQTSSTTSDMQMSPPINSLSETNIFYPESFAGFSAPPPPFILQPPQRCLKEITTESSTSRRLMLNEVQTVPPPPLQLSSSSFNEIIPIKTVHSNDLATDVRSGLSKPPRTSRFSDITPSVTREPPLNTNLPVDTFLNYQQITENINCLPSSRRQQKRHNREVMECECTTSEYDRSHGIKACGHECLNRMLLIECGPMCPCGQWCTNHRFQRHSYANHKLSIFKTEMKGHGIRTIASIRKGRFLVEYIGEVIDMDELARRNKKYKRDGNTHQYVMSLIHGTVIDSTIKGNWARFINHSCAPNCVAEKWLVNGEYRMGLFAKRDLSLGEEITIDYRFETFGTDDAANVKCYCGAATCRGTISVRNNNNNNNLNKRQNRRQPLDDDELLDSLHDDETNEYIIPKTIDEIRHLIQIMSRTDSENVRTIELDLIRNSSQKQIELPRLFLECNGLHVLCSWIKDILIDDLNNNDEQQYSQEFKYHLLDFIHYVIPIKDRTTVIKNGLLDLVCKKLKLTIPTMENSDDEQIHGVINAMLDHLNDPIIAKLFHLHSTWMSLKERYIIPKRKEPQPSSNHHHHHHHHHHSSKHSNEDNSNRFNFSARSSIVQQKPVERSMERRSFVIRDTPRTQEQQLSKDERRKLFEQQYEDAEKARTAVANAVTNDESPGTKTEPPHKKQRTSDNSEPMVPSTPPQPETSSMSITNSWSFPNAQYPHQVDQSFWIHRHLSQIPVDYIRSYMTSIGQPSSESSASIHGNDEPPLPPPPRPEDENEVSRIIRLPSGWSVAMCPSDSSVYFYNRQTMSTSWTPPISSLSPAIGTSVENSVPPPPPLDLSPLSSAQINDQHHPHQPSSSSRSTMKPSKHPHRHSRNHRHYHLHHPSSNNKRKRPSAVESTTLIKEEPHPQSTEEASAVTPLEHIKQEESSDNKPVTLTDEISSAIPKSSIDESNETTIINESSEINDNTEEQASSNNNNNTLSSSSSKLNRDLLRKNISQHVHTTLKPYTKRTCKQGRIVSTDDIKYLVKKFTLAVLDKEIEKAKNEGSPLAPTLTDRVRLKTEVYVKKYMNKMGPVFQRHDTTVHPPLPSQTTTNSE